MKGKKEKASYIKKLDRKLDFKMRLFLSFFIIAPPILIIVSIGSYMVLSKSARGETMKALMTTMERLRNQVEQVTVETENLSRNIIYNEDVQQLLEDSISGERYPSTTEAAYFINSFIVNREYIESVVILGKDDTVFSTERAFTDVSSIEAIREKWWYADMEQSPSPFAWYPQALMSKFPEKFETNHLMLTRSIRSLKDYKTPIGRMMIYIKESYFEGIWEELPWGKTTNLWIVDEKGEVLLRNHQSEDYDFLRTEILERQGVEIITADGKKYLVGNERFDDKDWRLLIATPFSEVDSSLTLVKAQIGLVAAIAFLVIVLVALFTATTMARPIKSLAIAMDSYHGKLPIEKRASIEEYNNRKDEVGVIYRSYQRLVQRIETLIKEIYLKDLEKKDAELALLETQINPHFLYNTLDSINWMALANNQEEISEMVTALSDTFRLSLTKNSGSFVRVEQEIQYIEGYMTIQKFRYGDRLCCRYSVEPETTRLQMLRFILQPVVENGLKHGIDKREEGGTIDIIVRLKFGNLSLVVINDGAEIDLERMERLLFFDVDNTEYLSFESEGYGIQNINRRIKIVHGREFGVRYEIVGGSRTSCEILLPIRCEKLNGEEV